METYEADNPNVLDIAISTTVRSCLKWCTCEMKKSVSKMECLLWYLLWTYLWT